MKTYYRIVTMDGDDGSMVYATSEEKREEKPKNAYCSNSLYDVYSAWYESEGERDLHVGVNESLFGKRVSLEEAAYLYCR